MAFRDSSAGASRPWAGALLVAAAVVACYANSLAVPFQFDDDPNIVLNPCADDLACWAGPLAGPATRRVGLFTLGLDRRLHGLDPAGFHVTNLAFHLAAALLLQALVAAALRAADREGRLTAHQTRGAALLAALVFACHPVQTQAVTYVVQRLASLATALYLASLLLYLRARIAPRPGGPGPAALLAAAVACALLAMQTKEIAFTLPLAAVLLDRALLEGGWRRRLAFLGPLLATLPVIPWLVLRGGRPVAEVLADAGAATRVQSAASRLDYLATQGRVVARYLGLLLLPVGQSVDPEQRLLSPWEPSALVPGVLLLALLALGVALVARARTAEFRVAGLGVVLFFLALSVESSFLPIGDVMFEHRLYLPSAGAALALAGGGLALWRGRGASGRRALVVAAAAWVVALGAATVARNAVWRDPLSLWGDAVAKGPGNARARCNYGNALRDRGDLPAAVRQWEEAVRLAPGMSTAWNQLGNAAVLAGDPGRATERYRRSLAADPRNAEALHNLAWLLERAGQGEEAVALYRRFVEVAPGYLQDQVAQVRARHGW